MHSKPPPPTKQKTSVGTTAEPVSIRLQRAMALHQSGHLLQAKVMYENILSTQPRNADALSLLAIVATQSGDHALAIETINKAIKIDPSNAGYYLNRGSAQKSLNQLTDAVASFNKAIVFKPAYAEAYSNRGVAQRELKQLTDAIASFNKAIAIDPGFAEAYSNKGHALRDHKQLEAAVASCDKAIAIKPNFAEAHSNRGNALRELNQLEAALASYDKAIAIKPDFAEAHSNRGLALQDCHQLDAALTSFDRAIALNPNYLESYFSKSQALLLGGDFDAGWALYEWRWKCKSTGLTKRKFHQPSWLGVESLKDKTILLYGEQGLGDTLQFCRYASLVAALGARVIIEAPKVLLEILRGLEGVSEVVANGSTLPAFDYHSPLLSLPWVFKTNISTIPSNQAYLKGDADFAIQWAEKLGVKTKPRVGIAWSGSGTHTNDHNRSIELSNLLPHLPEGLEYVSLQKELREVDKATLKNSPNFRHFGEDLHDFSDTAALCGLMDFVISVDTSVAHLSAALGRPTWVLLPYSPDWRWLLNRTDSPWYSSVKLYRQQAANDWESVLGILQSDLSKLTGVL